MATDGTFGALRGIGNATLQINKSLERLASGKRINKASDDAAGLAIAEALKASFQTREVATRNANDGISALQIADGAQAQISDILIRQKELATQANNGTLSEEQRGVLGQEFEALSQEVVRIRDTTEFNGVKLFSGSSTDFQVGTGSGADDRITLSSNSLSFADQLSSLSLTGGNAGAAIDAISGNIQTLASARGTGGAAEVRLNTSIPNNRTAQANEKAAESRIRDVDIAEESARFTAAKILQQGATAVLAQANQNRGRAFDLLS